ncbi:YHS domain-containing protein [bacterium]|nr:YHS domain-containing protein [bacterium]
MIYIDPVCKKKLHKKAAYAIVKYQGTAYHLCCRECKDAFEKNPAKYHVVEAERSHENADKQEIIDPVCGKHLRAQNHTLFTKYQGKEYRFCSKKCAELFKNDPEQYVRKTNTPTASPVEAGIT